ncbi:MAG: 3-hydroxyacyl-CoA dehydrogenase family protein, partial [Anaerolineae bacterium]|nr:3-hydroxyacyl-CoA dehydrogenase family protein [Anaerolineae bacterium]
MTRIKRVAVIGAGTMGRQISLQIALRGFGVVLYDIDPDALTAAENMQRETAADWIAAGQVSEGSQKRIFANLRYS